MPRHAEHSPETPHNFFAMFIASLGLAFGIMAGAEAIGAHELDKQATAQQGWNQENQAKETALLANKMVPIASDGQVRSHSTAPEPILVIPKHETKPVEPILREAQEKSKDAGRDGWLGGISLFLTTGNLLRKRSRRQQKTPATTVDEPGEPTCPGAIAERTCPVTYPNSGTSGRNARQSPWRSSNYYPINGPTPENSGPRWQTLQLKTADYADRVPPADKINPGYIQTFEPGVYVSQGYEGEIGMLNRMLAGHRN